jgi:hypothetical protein
VPTTGQLALGDSSGVVRAGCQRRAWRIDAVWRADAARRQRCRMYTQFTAGGDRLGAGFNLRHHGNCHRQQPGLQRAGTDHPEPARPAAGRLRELRHRQCNARRAYPAQRRGERRAARVARDSRQYQHRPRAVGGARYHRGQSRWRRRWRLRQRTDAVGLRGCAPSRESRRSRRRTIRARHGRASADRYQPHFAVRNLCQPHREQYGHQRRWGVPRCKRKRGHFIDTGRRRVDPAQSSERGWWRRVCARRRRIGRDERTIAGRCRQRARYFCQPGRARRRRRLPEQSGGPGQLTIWQ